MHFKMIKFILIVFAVILTGCANEINKDGKVLHYEKNDKNLYLIYQNKNENHLLNVKLNPMTEKWDKAISGHPGTPSMMIYRNHIACNCKKDKVCLLSKENGEKILDFDSTFIFSPGSKGFLLDDGTVYSICGSNSLCALDVETAEKIWEVQLDNDTSISIDLQIKDDILVYGTDDGVVHTLSASDGKEIWKTEPFEELTSINLFSNTIVVDRGDIDGLDVSTGKSKWIQQYPAKVRCVMDGILVVQEEEFFRAVFVENGSENGAYPRNGTTFLTCQEELSLMAFTVRNYNENMAESDTSEYFDKIYFFDAGSFERVFDFNSDAGHTVLNLTGFLTEKFDIALEDRNDHEKIQIDRYLVKEFEKNTSFKFSVENPGQQIYVNNMYSDSSYSIFRRTNINDQTDETNYLFKSDTGKLLGKMSGYPEIITSENSYDIVTYDEYFNIIEKSLEDFVD